MKVIKEGTWERKITCRDCKAVLLIESSDVRYGLYSTEYEQEFIGQFYIKCPSCTRLNVLKNVPELIQEEAKEQRAD